MGDISAKFRNNYSVNGMCTVWDAGRDPNDPPVVFHDNLNMGQETDWIALHEDGFVMYQRPEGERVSPPMVHDQDTVPMD